MTLAPLTPRTSDGKTIVLVNLFPGEVWPKHLGRADDVASGAKETGASMRIDVAPGADGVLEFQFVEWIYLAGGQAWYDGAFWGDEVTYTLRAPASPIVANGSNTGNANKIPVGGGANLIAPAAGNGAWDVDLAAKLNANVGFSAVVPVPSETGTGFFDWNADTNVVSVNAQQQGAFNLFDAELPLGGWASAIPLYGSRGLELTVPAVKVKRLLPHWKHRVVAHHEVGIGNLKIWWELFTGRKV